MILMPYILNEEMLFFKHMLKQFNTNKNHVYIN